LRINRQFASDTLMTSRTLRGLVIVLLPLLLLISGCSSTPKGFGAHAEKGNNLPGGVPQSIVIAPFSGDARITGIAMELMSAGLHQFGFKIVPWNMAKVESMTQFPAYDNIDESLRRLIQSNLGADGVLIGRATSEAEMFKSRSYLDLKLIKVDDGEVLWQTTVKGSTHKSWNSGFRVSIEKSIKKALKQFRKDLKKYGG